MKSHLAKAIATEDGYSIFAIEEKDASGNTIIQYVVETPSGEILVFNSKDEAWGYIKKMVKPNTTPSRPRM